MSSTSQAHVVDGIRAAASVRLFMMELDRSRCAAANAALVDEAALSLVALPHGAADGCW